MTIIMKQLVKGFIAVRLIEHGKEWIVMDDRDVGVLAAQVARKFPEINVEVMG